MAGFNINSFQTNISQYGVLQTNKFIVAFASPPIMQNVTVSGASTLSTEQLIQVRAESVKIPGVTLLQTDVQRYGIGSVQKMPFAARFTENSITFISDRNGEIYKYFYTWMNKIFDFSGTADATNVSASYLTEYKDNYATDLHVYVFDNSGNQIKDIVMYRAYPESINDINLDWSNNNQLMKVTVSMTFRDWAMLGVSNNKGGAVQPTTAPTTSYSAPTTSQTTSI
jgi:hypothetical protein